MMDLLSGAFLTTAIAPCPLMQLYDRSKCFSVSSPVNKVCSATALSRQQQRIKCHYPDLFRRLFTE